MIIKVLFPSAVTLHRPWLPILISHLFYPGLFLVLGRSFFTARVFLVEISLLFLEITGHLLVTYMQNISDCSIREYRSIVATATGHHVVRPYILIKTAYFNYVDISTSFKKFCKKLHLLVFVIIKLAMLLWFTNPSKRSTFNVRLVSA